MIDCLKRSRSDDRLSGCEAVGDAGAGLGAGVMAGLGADAAAPFAGPGAGVVEEAAAAGFGPAEAAAGGDGLEAADTTTASFSSRISSSTCTGYEPYASFLCRFVGMHFVTIAAIVVHCSRETASALSDDIREIIRLDFYCCSQAHYSANKFSSNVAA